MSSFYQHFLICFLAATALGASFKREAQCPEAYRQISRQHTMCLTDVGTQIVLTQQDKDAALREHNDIRARVSPKAANMMKLAWDDDLAMVAAKWAAQCTAGHDKIRSLPKLPGVWVGQNLAGGNMDLVQAIQYWETEIKDFHYGGSPSGVVGHYTQIVFGQTVLVGCGVANCPNSRYRKFQVCNYAVGQFNNAFSKPYKRGFQGCDDCPNSCDGTGKLCDCGGKVCLNKGELDINTCKCKCSKLYTGSNCQTVNCYPDDNLCPQYKQVFGDNVCNKYVNVPPLCPHMCGVC